MKTHAIVFLTLFAPLVKAQELPVKKNEYKLFNITYSSYAKPQASSLSSFNSTINEQTYSSLQRNNGFSLKYSQMNFIQNCGIEFGIGAEIIRTSNEFTFSLPGTSGYEKVELSPMRSNVGFVTIPLYYVHRIELGKGFTLFPKIGADAKVMITNPDVRYGVTADSLNNLRYNVGYETSQRYSNSLFQNVFLNGTIAASLVYSMKKGGAFGLNFAFSMQVLPNTLLTNIHHITYKRDGVVTYGSEGPYYSNSPRFLAENKMNSFSLGVSYLFGK